MKIINKTLFFLFLIIGTLYKAGIPDDVPAPPPGGGGGTGPGAPSSPIDMYVYILALVGFLLIIYFARKQHKTIA
ncbi:signal peptidase [Kaistella gelatinilytica]|uniref:signal peptidase n=1 Tax=Kaistella gelatinilytica TaxID=2787636 RepID=UPI001E4547F3|nr:signal peptidase [Kaistella gelatinilytica]